MPDTQLPDIQLPNTQRWPLSAAQHGFWIGQQLDPDSPAYNTAEYVEIHGLIDTAVFESALRRVVGETEALQVRFGADGQLPYQLLDQPPDWALAAVDLTAAPDPQRAAQTWMAADLARTVDLGTGPLFGHALLRTGPRTFLWYHRVHHIALDGFGLALFARRLAEVYTALLAGRVPDKSPFGSLRDVLAEDQAYAASAQRESDRAYWTRRFADRPEPVTLSDRTALAAWESLRRSVPLDPDTTQLLRAAAKANSVSWPDLILASTAAYLHRMTGAPEVVLGLPVMGRLGSMSLRVPCTAMNVVPLRVPVDRADSLAELATRIASELRQTRPHHRYRYEDLRRDLTLLGGRRGLFGPAVNIMPFDYGLRFAGQPGSVTNVSPGPIEDLSIAVYDRADGNGLQLTFGANPQRYTADELTEHQTTFLELLRTGAAEPRRPVSSLGAVRPSGVLDGGPLPGPARSVVELVVEQARLRPDAIAVEYGAQHVNYAELAQRASRVATRLRHAGVRPGDLVAILLPHGIDAVVAILGALFAGAGYLPLDTKGLPQRRTEMVATSTPVALVTSPAHVEDLTGPELPTVLLGEDAELSGPVDPALPGRPEPGSTAYVLFTSGSTGAPKGVMISHRALASYVAGATAYYQVRSDDRALHFLPLHFDGHVEEIFLTLCAGATLVIRSEEMTQSVTRMVAGWAEHRLTLLNVPTTYWHEVVYSLSTGTATLPSCIRTVIIGGEAALPERVRRWHALAPPSARLLNTYGPTEATVVATATWLRPEDHTEVPIGRPLPGVRAVIVDERGLLAPLGAVGELYLVGDTLATGYLGRPDLDRTRFVTLHQLADRPRAYRTGDLVRRGPDGRLRFVGRLDDEFKISGHRVDPGEVESVLLACPGVREVAVVGQVLADGTRNLAAYVVAGQPAPAAAQLRAQARRSLAAALVPTIVEFVPELPKTPTGKVDRKSLRAQMSSGTAPATGSPADSPLQETVLKVWEQVLGIRELPPDADFFEIGGQSLQTIQVANRLTAEIGREVSVAMVFRYPTVAELAASLESDSGPDSGTGEESTRSVRAMRADAVLDPAITPATTCSATTTGTARQILLTGATGFLGSHLLATLLSLPDTVVHCLVRVANESPYQSPPEVTDQTAAINRIHQALAAHKLPSRGFGDRIHAVPGDLTRPRLGLTSDRFRDLAATCDAIYHNGASVSVMREYTSLRAVNVYGTREMVRMAAAVRAVPLHYVSTLNVAPPCTVRAEVPEAFIAEHSALLDGYQQSKWAAERLVQQAGERGLPVAVYRLARLVGSPDTGFVNAEDLLWRILRVGIPAGAIPELYRADAWTPVDFVARAIVHLSRQVPAAGTVFNLVPAPELPLTELCTWIRDYGYPVELLPMRRWLDELPDRTKDITTMAFFDLWSGAGEQEPDLEIGTIRIDNVTRGLAGSGVVCPPPSGELVARYLDYAVRTGLLPAPQTAGSVR